MIRPPPRSTLTYTRFPDTTLFRSLPVDQENPGEKPMRAGIFLANGTGAGKTNEILGTILDNVLHGRAKNILVLAKRRHRHGFLEAWAKMGRDRREFVFQWELKPGQANRKHNTNVVQTGKRA